MSASDPGKLDRIAADARRAAEKRERGYRERALKIYPWICGRCAREFTRANVRELTTYAPFADLKELLAKNRPPK